MNRSQPERVILIGCLAASTYVFVLFTALAVGLVLLFVNVVSHIQIDPAAVDDLVKSSIVATLKDGQPDQKVDLLNSLRGLGKDATRFVPEITDALNDNDARVRAAATEALKAIDPAAAGKAGIK
jgi:hypothetical protein